MAADLEEARLRLREWAYYFADKGRKSRTMSAEGAWRSPQCWDPPQPKPNYGLLRAIATYEILKTKIPIPNYRALTVRYCLPPYLPIHIGLRHLSRRLKRRINLKDYEELVYFGEHRLAVALYNEITTAYSVQPISGERRASTVS